MAAPLVAGAISALKMVKQYDTQEILWGDLLHSSNILGAFNLTSRPAELDFLRLQFRERKELADETEEDYSNDGRIDAGETVINRFLEESCHGSQKVICPRAAAHAGARRGAPHDGLRG